MLSVNPAFMSLLNLAGWWFLPDMVAQRALGFLHSFFRSRGRQTPQPGTLAYVTHYRRMYATVILGYLIYSLVDSVSRTPPNLYEILGVSKYATEPELKTAFRFFAKRYHPDRAGVQGEAMFISVRDAYDGLRDPVKRFAYDRFGRDVFSWKDATIVDFLYSGAKSQIGFYIGTFLVLIFFSFIQKQSSLSFWRYFLLIATLTIELQLILAPHILSLPLSALGLIFPNQVTYQHILFLHQVYVSSSIALTRVFPVLFAGNPTESTDPKLLRHCVETLIQSVRKVDHHVSSLILNDMRLLMIPTSLKPGEKPTADLDDETYAIISEELESVVIERTLRAHPATRIVWDAALTRIDVRRKEEEERASPALEQHQDHDDAPLANGSGFYEGKDISPETTPSVHGGRFRFLSPDSDDGREHRPRSKRERSPSP